MAVLRSEKRCSPSFRQSNICNVQRPSILSSAGGRAEGLTVEFLGGLPGVQGARITNDEYELNVGELHRAVPALLSSLAERRLELSKLTTHSATLEDVFVHLTGRQLREA